MIKKIIGVILSLLLVFVFYVYAILQEDDTKKQAEQWIVSETKAPLPQPAPLTSSDRQQLASAMACNLPLPSPLQSGSVHTGTYHGYPVLMVEANAADLQVKGVRPLTAASLIRSPNLQWLPSNTALFGFPLLSARHEGSLYYYMLTEDAAFELRISTPDEAKASELLNGITLVSP